MSKQATKKQLSVAGEAGPERRLAQGGADRSDDEQAMGRRDHGGPAPREVDAIMKAVPEGKLITIHEIRAILAKRHGATIGCPLTTGIFAWIAAHAAEEDLECRPRRRHAVLADAQDRAAS